MKKTKILTKKNMMNRIVRALRRLRVRYLTSVNVNRIARFILGR